MSIRTTTVAGLLGLAFLAITFITPTERVVATNAARPAPEFTQQSADAWLNSEPLKLSELRDQVVLLDIWTFDCWNCYRSFPWLNAMEKRLSQQGFKVIGIHTPEFEHEKVRAKVAAKISEFNLHHPVMMDNDFSYWRALGNRYWPTYYLIDKQGQIRATFVGETHANTPRAKKIEDAIALLLAE